ncbi:MAG: NAD-dependent epimerase/dehydratase family protein [Candidatus Omnitrophota bacterium]
MPDYFIAGGAGFIGSHLVTEILNEESSSGVVVFDNFSSGSPGHLEHLKGNGRLKIVEGDLKDAQALIKALDGADTVYHFASNPDIAKALRQPDIDFWEGTYLTNNILEAMRKNGVKNIIYASGSGVYGDTGELEVNEEYSPLAPISTYGASKLSCEAMISSYCHMFGMRGCALRFANVVGGRQTHGVGFDFIGKLKKDPKVLKILGDGNQSKSYLAAEDAVNAMRLLQRNMPERFSCYNAATRDHLTVKEIADIVVAVMGLKGVKYEYTGGQRGWKGDVPIVRMNSDKLRSLGWDNKRTSKEALRLSVEALYKEKER